MFARTARSMGVSLFLAVAATTRIEEARATPLPDWKLKAVLAYPKAAERSAMLLEAVKEHCDLSAIQGIDAEALLAKQVLPGVLATASDFASARRSIDDTMKSLRCDALAPTPRSTPPASAQTSGTPLPPSAAMKAAASAQRSGTLQTHATDNADATTTPSNAERLQQDAATATTAAKEIAQGAEALQSLPGCLKREKKSNRGKTDRSRDAMHDESLCNVEASKGLSDAQRTLADLSDKQHKMNLASYKMLKDANAEAQQLNKASDAASITQAALDATSTAIEQSTNAALSRVSQYGIYAGPNYSLAGDGSWKSGAEFLVQFEHEAMSPDDGDKSNWACWPIFIWCRSYLNASYQSIAALDKSKQSVDAPFDVFAQSGGYFRLNTGWRMHLNDWIGVQAGVGLSSLPNGAGADQTKLKPRETLGFHFQTLYSDGSLGQFFIGTAHDKFWSRAVANDTNDPTAGSHLEKNRSRWIADGILMIPGINLGGWKAAARLSADTPTDGRGPSDVRTSFLLYYPLNDWIQKNLPSKPADDGSK